MPALFSMAMHPGLERAAPALEEGEAILSFLDDIYVIAKRRNARRLYDITTREVEQAARIRTNQGKTRAWGAGRKPPPPGVAELGRKVWKGDTPDAARSGLLILGIPVGTIEYERRMSADRLLSAEAMAQRSTEPPPADDPDYAPSEGTEAKLLRLLPDIPDPQSWWLLLRMCAEPRANHLLRAVPPHRIQDFARAHDAGLIGNLNQL